MTDVTGVAIPIDEEVVCILVGDSHGSVRTASE